MSTSGHKRRDAIALELRIVVVVEVVEADDGVATRLQRAADVGTDESGGAGDEDGHGSPDALPPSLA